MKHKGKPAILTDAKMNLSTKFNMPSIFYRYLYLCIILSVSVNGQAQNWAPDGAVWTYTQTFVFSSRIDTLVIRTTGDTLIQDKNCKILKRSFGTCDLRPTKEYMYADNGKVFFYDESRTEFQKLYDFNAEAGQSYTIYLDFPDNLTSFDSITVTIDSVRSILINGVLLKKQFVSYLSSDWHWVVGNQGITIEGIGDTWSMFPWFYGACDANWAGPLRCYYDNVIGLVDFETAPSCDYVALGIEDSEATGYFKVYPNPANEFVVFEIDPSIGTRYVVSLPPNQSLPETSQTITITDIAARPVAFIPLTADKTVWQTDGITPGVYLYRLQTLEGTGSGRLLITP